MTEGRQLFAGDGEGSAYLVQLAEQRVFEIDETGHAKFHSEIESNAPLSGALRAAVGAEGKVWVFGYLFSRVTVVVDGAEVEIENPGASVNGLVVTGGRPTLALDLSRPLIGDDLEKKDLRDRIPPLVVQLDANGTWQPWIERTEMDLYSEDEPVPNLLAMQDQLAGDTDGRLLMARQYRYEARAYNDDGNMVDRLLDGEVVMVERSPEQNKQLKEADVPFDPRGRLPRSSIEGVAWSPDAEILILAKLESGGYALDRWLPALQERYRLAVPELDGQRRLQMAAGYGGLMLLPANSTRLVVLPWEYLREAEWENLTGDEDVPETPNWAAEPEQEAVEGSERQLTSLINRRAAPPSGC